MKGREKAVELSEILRGKTRNSIRLFPQDSVCEKTGCTRFGGVPDLPPNFRWPCFTTETYDDPVERPRSLTFLAQFNCAELAPLDPDGWLPKTGLLSFFYELVSQRWGFDPKDAGCARVYWFERTDDLLPAAIPPGPEEPPMLLPALGIRAEAEKSLPGFEDLAPEESGRFQWDSYSDALLALGVQEPESCHKLLGWPNTLQGNMTVQCELISQGYYMGDALENIPKASWERARHTSTEDWRLLFQMDTLGQGDCVPMFGDCGRIYFYIRKEDLLARRFDRVWLILQCC